MSEQENREPAKEAKRSRPLPTILLVCVLAGIVAFAIYYFVAGRGEIETDDAYVNGNLVRLTPQVSGTVIAAFVEVANALRSLEHDGDGYLAHRDRKSVV